MEINQYIMKNFKNEDIRRIIFIVKKKTNGIISVEELLQTIQKTTYYVCKVLNNYSYNYYNTTKNNVFDIVIDFLVDSSEKGVCFKTIV